MKKIAILNYGLGNVRSVCNAVVTCGAEAEISFDKNCIMTSDGLILPGVGAFPQGMSNLLNGGLDEVIREYIATGRPVLGICLGMQLLFDRSMEFIETKGLGLINGSVEIIPIHPHIGRLPHIAWSEVTPSEEGRQKMFEGLSENEMRMYFVHSYTATSVSLNNISATVSYFGNKIVAAVHSGNIWGTQFHPEKSGPNGLHLLKNFIKNC